MHKYEDYSLVDLLKHLRIEEEPRKWEKKAKGHCECQQHVGLEKGKETSKSRGPTKKWNPGSTYKIFQEAVSVLKPKELQEVWKVLRLWRDETICSRV